ncbi:MAG: hypothetical protein ACFB10_18630, partial [Salibacteraceae bacterium]
VFGTYGGVADEFENFALNEFRNTAGGGLRFLLDRKRHINIRLDAGFGKNTKGFYLNIAEAF